MSNPFKKHGFIPDRPIGKGRHTSWREGAAHNAKVSKSNRRKAARRAKVGK